MDKLFLIDQNGSVIGFDRDCSNCENYILGRWSSYKCASPCGPYSGEAVGPYFSCDEWELAEHVIERLAIHL